ncbi:single-stranded-DNA-specific exonuclease RecJ [Erythrobacter aureus]|uniref:single-stranded-DNA-specific exonuclease RecJ n=1 Tax=Erythrobacter aureus TaxID=2182384 RepID=UPI0013B37D3D|nr:single-stranded-DNA-specific exonuclease RecJ [Erythrobacter aureus]
MDVYGLGVAEPVVKPRFVAQENFERFPYVTETTSILENRTSALGRKWSLRDSTGFDYAPESDGPSRLQARVAHARGSSQEDLPGLMNPALKEHMPDPSVLTDMDKAAMRLASAVKHDEVILVFGDYDVDGATSTAIVQRYLASAKAKHVITHVPDRDNGYGFGDDNCAAAIAEKPGVIVLLDCGTQNHETIAKATGEGIDVIVVDHHQPSDTLPNALALVNPHRHDETEDGQKLRNLCTAGLAFMLAAAVNRDLRNAGFFSEGEAPNPSTLLDLVALGTVCDVMKLTGLNRSFVKLGLRRLERKENPGLCALARVSGVREGAGATALGFHLGPRINAGGRIGKARLGADLLASNDPDFCDQVADELNQLNADRRAIENQVLEEATSMVSDDDDIIVVGKEGWHHGVIGIVAGRLKETFNRPAIVIGIDENGIGKGSGRSISGVDLGKAIMDAVKSGHLVAGGGHVMACGLTIEPSKIDGLREHLNATLSAETAQAREQNSTQFDDFVYTSDLTPGFVNEIEQMGPYGQGWPKPRYILGPASIDRIHELKGGHVKFQIADDNGSIDAIAFRAADNGILEALQSGKKLLIAGQADINVWQGRTSMQFLVDDVMEAHPTS